MKIIVVKTCDGDIYFTSRGKQRASNVALQQVLYNDLGRYDAEDRDAVRDVMFNPKQLYKELLRIGAIHEAQTC